MSLGAHRRSFLALRSRRTIAAQWCKRSHSSMAPSCGSGPGTFNVRRPAHAATRHPGARPSNQGGLTPNPVGATLARRGGLVSVRATEPRPHSRTANLRIRPMIDAYRAPKIFIPLVLIVTLVGNHGFDEPVEAIWEALADA